MISATVSTQRKKIHPHKFTLWVGLGSIVMMFAGLTSAYIVKGSQPEWTTVELPNVFYYSTAAIIASSITIQMALKAFKERSMMNYRRLLLKKMNGRKNPREPCWLVRKYIMV